MVLPYPMPLAIFSSVGRVHGVARFICVGGNTLTPAIMMMALRSAATVLAVTRAEIQTGQLCVAQSWHEHLF